MSIEAGMAWLPERSVDAVREAVAHAVPSLARERIELHDDIPAGDAAWRRGTAWLGDAYVVKYAWSPQAAAEVRREGQVMQVLAKTAFAQFMPAIGHFSVTPVLLILRRCPGVPVPHAAQADPAAPGRIGRDLGAALAVLHRPDVLRAVEHAGPSARPPTPQAETTAIRDRLATFVSPGHVALVQRWCDWVDETQARCDPPRLPVLLHGDLHGYNVLCEHGRVSRVLDYDAVSLGDHHFDFRYLPGGLTGSIELFTAAARRYEALTRRRVAPAPVLAWHIRTVLGDALWRSEAGVELPDRGTPDEWIVALRRRIEHLAAWRAFPQPGG